MGAEDFEMEEDEEISLLAMRKVAHEKAPGDEVSIEILKLG